MHVYTYWVHPCKDTNMLILKWVSLGRFKQFLKTDYKSYLFIFLDLEIDSANTNLIFYLRNRLLNNQNVFQIILFYQNPELVLIIYSYKKGINYSFK